MAEDTLVVSVTGYDADRMERMLASFLQQQVSEETQKRIRDTVAKQVDHCVGEITTNLLRAEVEAIVAEGWRETDTYGDATGRTITLRQRVAKTLDGRDQYSRERHLDKLFTETLNAALRKELAEELQAARTAFRAKVDAVLNAKLHEALRDSLGLKA